MTQRQAYHSPCHLDDAAITDDLPEHATAPDTVPHCRRLIYFGSATMTAARPLNRSHHHPEKP
jgi:hypothetical protein